MHLLIPPLKSQIELDRDWTFDLYDEYRNHDAATKFFGVWAEMQTARVEQRKQNAALKEKYSQEHPDIKIQYGLRIPGVTYRQVSVPVTIPKGSVLIVDRIYIRNGGPDYDSITFRLASTPTNKPKGKKSLCRFWAKLRDVNEIHFVDTRDWLFGGGD